MTSENKLNILNIGLRKTSHSTSNRSVKLKFDKFYITSLNKSVDLFNRKRSDRVTFSVSCVLF